MILCVSVLSNVISPFSFLILLIWFFSLCSLMTLANGLLILFILSVLLTFAIVYFVSFSLISALIFMIYFLLLTLKFFISSFSCCFTCKVRLFFDVSPVSWVKLVLLWSLPFSSLQFSHSVMSDSLQPHEPQHTRPPCLSATPRVYLNSCPLSQWCHPTISSSVVPFSSCPQSFPASGSSQMSQLFTSGGQNIGISASTSVLLMNTQDWSPLGWTGWISLQSKGLPRVFSKSTV